MSVKFANNAHSTLASSITTSATSITVASGQGARFPSLSSGEYFYATLIDTSNNLEIVKVTARSTDVLTATRAQESTTARAFSSGDRIELRVTAQGLIDATTIQADQIVNSMIATDAVNSDSILANAITASELNITGNGTAGQVLVTDGDGSFSYGTGGGLIRTEQTHKTNVHQRTSSSFGDIPDLTLSFAPASASNKVLLMLSGMAEMSSGNDGYYTFARDGTNLGNSNGFSNKQGESIRHTLHFSFLDQPNTTSTVSYTVQHRVNGGTSSFNNGTVKANFIALEVAV